MANKFSFEAQEQQAIMQVFQTLVDETATATKEFAEKVREICDETHYKPFVDLGFQCFNFYETIVHQMVLYSFNEWREGAGCLAGYIERLGGGKDAYNTAQILEADMQYKIVEMFPTIDKPNPATDDPRASEEHFERLRDSVVDYKNKLEDIGKTAADKVESQMDENNAFGCIKPPVTSIPEMISAAFEEIEKGFEEVQTQFTDMINQSNQVTDMVTDEMGKQAIEQGENAFDAIRSNFRLKLDAR